MEVIKTFQCPICLEYYQTEEDAQECLDRGSPSHRFKVGDTVYIKLRYPKDNGVEYIRANVLGLAQSDHISPNYAIDKTVQIGKDYYAGNSLCKDDYTSWIGPCFESSMFTKQEIGDSLYDDEP